ncbi:MAG: hypothetical protein M3243_05230 [Thermoproteota archaeon]|nr:hypothetical protein [Thermoproteota archaeon]
MGSPQGRITQGLLLPGCLSSTILFGTPMDIYTFGIPIHNRVGDHDSSSYYDEARSTLLLTCRSV